MADLDLASMHPRRIVGSILEDDEPAGGTLSPNPMPPVTVGALAPGETPPYDLDAT